MITKRLFQKGKEPPNNKEEHTAEKEPEKGDYVFDYHLLQKDRENDS